MTDPFPRSQNRAHVDAAPESAQLPATAEDDGTGLDKLPPPPPWLAAPANAENTLSLADDAPLADATDYPFLERPAGPGELGRLGHYIVQEVVGRGGMGVVFKALDERLNRVVAIKVLGSQFAASANARQRFEREAKAAAAVSHDHIVAIYHVDEHKGTAYLVMPLIVGKSLQARITESGPLELKEILRIGAQIASGLAAAHKQGLVHRDIKPANILLEESPSPPTSLPQGARGEVGRVKITDFGLARAVDDANLSQSGVVAGTPMYMSPEQASGTAVDHRSDLFSLGSVLYEMATGNPPFRACGTIGVLKRVCEEAPPPMRAANPNVPPWLEAIVAKLHAKQPADRFQSAQEVADLLGQHLAHLQEPRSVPRPAPVQPLTPPMPARHSSGVVGVLVIGAVVCAGLCVLSAPVVAVLGVAYSFLAPQHIAMNDAAPDRERASEMNDKAAVTRAPQGKRFDWGDAVDPAEDCRFVEEPGRFTIHVPAGIHDFFRGSNSNFDAPRLLREVDGDFSAVVNVKPFDLKGIAPPGLNLPTPRVRPAIDIDMDPRPFQAAGLLVLENRENFIRYVMAKPGVEGKFRAEACAWTWREADAKPYSCELKPGQHYLNLERQGKTFRIRWGADGKNWREFVNLAEVDFAHKLQVGLLAVNNSTQSFSPQFEGYAVDLLPAKGGKQ
jgi:serine/threonine protein kinase